MAPSSALYEWAHHYHRIAQEQQRSVHAIPDRMPTLEMVNEMLRNSEKISNSLNEMQIMIEQQQAEVAADRRNREQGLKGSSEYDDEMSMYGDDLKGSGYGAEGKKRRGVRETSSAVGRNLTFA